MFKVIGLLAVMVGLFSASDVKANTSSDYYTGQLHAKSSMQRRIDVNSGRSHITMWDARVCMESGQCHQLPISCKFFDPYGRLAVQQNNVMRCDGFTNLVLPSHVVVQITNNNDEDIEFGIMVANSQ